MEKIIITDGYTLNPGDLSWAKLATLGTITIFERTSPEMVSERCAGATVIVTNKTPINANVMSAVHGLKVIAVTATGYNVVDIGAARARGIAVCNVPGYGTESVAQHTFALILELTNHVGKNSSSVSGGEWPHSPDWCYSKAPIMELSGKTLGIVGYGSIGQKVATIATAFNMKVIYYNRSLKKGPGLQVTLKEVFSESDFVSLHVPLQKDNEAFVNSDLLSLMKATAFLVNTSRGQLIHEGDLRFALKNRRIAGAALDVLSKEPPPADHPLIGLDNCIITPHNAWLSKEARGRIMEETFENVRAALAGHPRNVVG
jgi:glycerate dehydrogenase